MSMTAQQLNAAAFYLANLSQDDMRAMLSSFSPNQQDAVYTVLNAYKKTQNTAIINANTALNTILTDQNKLADPLTG